MEKMPEQKDGHITLWRGGKWVQIPMSEMPKIVEEDKRGTAEKDKLPAGA